jgi:outer membrane protein
MRLALALLAAALACAEVHTMTLGQVLDAAERQNPDILIARLDQRIGELQIAIQRDPFIPKVYVGSGAAYTAGFPMSIDGAAPSIFRSQSVASVLNRPQQYRVAQARESARGAEHAAEKRRTGAYARTVQLFLDAERAARNTGVAGRQAESAAKVLAVVQQRVEDGRELPIEEKKARLEILRARRAAESFGLQQAAAESALAGVLGFAPGDLVRPLVIDRPAVDTPASEQSAMQAALAGEPEIRRLESAIAAKQWEARASRAERLPRLDLVAQYSLLSRFNNFEDFFQRFQRNNAQLGLSLQIPLFTGPAVTARALQAEAEIERLKLELQSVRAATAAEARQAWLRVNDARSQREFARLDLDVARENLGILLALLEEGKAGLRAIEEARLLESAKWIQYYDAQYALELAQVDLLTRTGELLSALR